MTQATTSISTKSLVVGGTLQKRGVHKKDGVTSRVRLAPAAICVGLVSLAHFSLLLTAGAPASASETKECVTNGTKVTCSCDLTSASEKEAMSAVLSQDKNTLRFECKSNSDSVPGGAETAVVCPEGTSDLTKCDIQLSSLLAGDSKSVKWVPCPSKEEHCKQCASLTIPQNNFPYVDKKFAVGCKEQNGNKLRIVGVTLQARPSATNAQTVTCAYGASSNGSHQTVKLSPTQSSFTLVCGEKGEVLPAQYNKHYCSSDSQEAEKTCSEDYTSILPGYDGSWWEATEASNTYTLSIPADKFPKEETKIVVGCQQQQPVAPPPSGKKEGKKEPSPTVCSVDVTIAAGSVSSLDQRVALFSVWFLGVGVVLAHVL
ncbi:SAG-related sequence [Besnoitia besnoiti]|uniref:SAG-related sequence n=1 Tax=Besnoitia besnoiti TaxID=94643 RepID=A0A2A9MKY9_BESBE|nr:SAG-related sequence [Besnoitia besnoiti]PFH36102.1 SAG-related sequence [Besnoitia besnoiti]